ncbi:hypothetical protein FQR65_LT20806 [Abscondita terminalis]|nr:hypothetical protein FQR65_LT20806 [Abscondita terminalis]
MKSHALHVEDAGVAGLNIEDQVNPSAPSPPPCRTTRPRPRHHGLARDVRGVEGLGAAVDRAKALQVCPAPTRSSPEAMASLDESPRPGGRWTALRTSASTVSSTPFAAAGRVRRDRAAARRARRGGVLGPVETDADSSERLYELNDYEAYASVRSPAFRFECQTHRARMRPQRARAQGSAAMTDQGREEWASRRRRRTTANLEGQTPRRTACCTAATVAGARRHPVVRRRRAPAVARELPTASSTSLRAEERATAALDPLHARAHPTAPLDGEYRWICAHAVFRNRRDDPDAKRTHD